MNTKWDLTCLPATALHDVGLPEPDKKETCLMFAAAPATPGKGSVKLSVASNCSIHSKL